MNRWRVGEDRGSKETDGCPLTVGSIVGTRDVNKVKMEGEDGDYPPVDTSTGRDVRIRQHPFDIPRIDF
jgi:hypothetical protein